MSLDTPSIPISRRLDVLGVLALAAATLLPPARGDGPAVPDALATRVRQPVALAASPDGDRLYAANRRSGSLSVIDVRSARVVAEHDVGRALAGLVALADGRHLLAVDREGDALILLEADRGTVRVVERRQVAADPVSVAVAPDGGSCVVASTWSRRLTFVGIARDGGIRLTTGRTLDLPFSPRDLALAGGGAKLVVADAFGGRLAVVDPTRGVLESVRRFPAHNIRGLAVTADGRELVLAHQVLSRRAKTDFEDVHWGRLLTSHLRTLSLDAVLSAGSDDDLLRGGCLIDLGSANDGAGDPAALAIDRSGRGSVAVALAGVGEVALGRSPTGHVRRLEVGGRPSALALSPDGRVLYIADAQANAVSVVEVESGRVARVIGLGPRPEPTLAERGEALFHDARLSHDGWMSCQSCHTDGHTSGQLADTLGDESYGAPKLIPSLLGTGATGPWAWAGSVGRLEDQVRKSVERTMRGPSPSDEQVEALTAYLRSLPAPRPSGPASPDDSVARGREVFRGRKCAGCHASPDYTSTRRYDVGLADEAGRREFNPPSLRGVGRREPLLHDGRAATLEEVFLEHRHPRDTPMTSDEVADLAAFLRTL